MSSQSAKPSVMPVSLPGEAVRLTTQHIDRKCRVPPATMNLPSGKWRGAIDPGATARWMGPRQSLQSCAPDSVFMPRGTKAMTMDCFTVASLSLSENRTAGLTRTKMISSRGPGDEVTGASVSPLERNARILDTIDVELHAGRPVAVAVSYAAGGEPAGDGLTNHWFCVVARDILPDGRVCYVGQDNATAASREFRLFVNQDDLRLFKPGLRDPRFATDFEYTVVVAVPIQH